MLGNPGKLEGAGLLPVILLVMGVLLLVMGISTSSYAKKAIYLRSSGNMRERRKRSRIVSSVDSITSLPPLGYLKRKIERSLSLGVVDEERLKLMANTALLLLFLMSMLNLLLLRNIGQLWYVKLLLVLVSVFLPCYVLTLVFDLYRQHISRSIPKLIDEFRVAFIKYRKIKPALMESCRHVDKGLAKVVQKAADAPYMEERLQSLKESFDNLWFNIFVVLVINFKNNGGELIDQLYKLNKTMTRYNNLEKKKSKRLVWYELFAVAAAVFSIPAVFWINTAILGGDAGVLIDARSNMMVSRIIGFSILSLVVVRILRKI